MEKLKKKGHGHAVLYIILLIAAVTIMLSIRMCRRGKEASESMAVGGDTIAVALQYSPVSFFMDGDTLGGFDYSLLKQLGLPIKIFPISTPEEGLVGLDEDRFDLVVADFPQSIADSGKYQFTIPAYLDKQVLVQMVDTAGTGSRIASVLELAGDTVYVTQGSPMRTRIENIARETGSEIFVEEVPTTSEKLLIKQAIGEINGPVVVNEQVARSLAADYPTMDYSLQISFSQFQPWVLRHDDAKLTETINGRLDSLKATPEYQKLVERYLK